MRDSDRRRFLRLVGTASVVGLAGCGGGGNGGGNGNGDGENGGQESLSGEDYPAVDQWLTEEDVGAADDTYDGTIVNRQDQDTVEVGVGTEGNGGFFAFGPSAVAVSTGTTVRWVWTGEGGAHNVVADPDSQIGETDFEFDSGDPVTEEGTEFTQTFDETGTALYHCVPHLSLGMKGAVVVL